MRSRGFLSDSYATATDAPSLAATIRNPGILWVTRHRLACRSLLQDQEALTGYAPPEHRGIVPVVVVAGGYPSDALSRTHVDDLLAQEGLLQDPAVDPLCIINMAELEMLEGLAEAGRSPDKLLSAWKHSGLRSVSFWNFVIREANSNSPRPSSILEQVESDFNEAAARLRGRGSSNN